VDTFTVGMLLAMVVGAIVCYVVANRNQMSTIWWPMFGFILPLLGVIVTIIVAVLKSKRRVDENLTEDAMPADLAT
jgi:ABC-type uncharacterized transport system permease subunit